MMAPFENDHDSGPLGGREDREPPSQAPDQPAPASMAPENSSATSPGAPANPGGGNGRSAESHGVEAVAPTNGRNKWGTHAARVLCMVSRKGGVGKTTSTVNLGAAFALNGHTVLVVGVDPQCGVSRTLGYGQQDLRCGLMDVFDSTSSLSDIACPTPLKDLYFVSPSIWSLDDEERYATLMRERADVFVGEVARARNLYDTILIDCPPGLHPATRAALMASDGYLVPVQAEELCRDSLGRLLSFVEDFTARDLGSAAEPPQLDGMFLTMVSDRTRMGRHVAAEVAREYGEHVYRTGIPRTIRLTEMALRGRPAVIYDRRSAGSRAYFDLMDEICESYRHRTGNGNGGRPAQTDGKAGAASEPSATSEAPASASSAERPRGVAGLLADLEASRSSRSAANPTSGPASGSAPSSPVDPGPAGRAGRGGLPGMLAELAGQDGEMPLDPLGLAGLLGIRAEEEPDVVSLDQLLDEEESGTREQDPEAGWDDEEWNGGWRGGRGRFH